MAVRKTERDQGWAWVVLAASAGSLFIFIVLGASIGFFQVEIMDDLGVGSGPISIMSSLALGQACLLGPVSGILASLLSVRVTVYLGVCLYSGGLVLASFSQSLPSLIFFFGFLTGFGFGIAYTASIVIISLHFDKHRLLANGVIMCAPGLGILSIPHVVSWAMSEQGWRWTSTMMGGFVLHVAVLASVYFPTDTERQTMLDLGALWESLSARCRGLEPQGQEPDEEGVQQEETAGMSEQQGQVVGLLQMGEGESEDTHAEKCGAVKNAVKDATDRPRITTRGGEDSQALNLTDNGSEVVEPGNPQSCEIEEIPTSKPDIAKDEIKNDKDYEISDIMSVKNTINDNGTLSNLSINFKEFLSGEDRKSFKIADHMLWLNKGDSQPGSLKSLPLTFRERNGVIECLSISPRSDHFKHSSDLKDSSHFTPSHNGVDAPSSIPTAFLTASTEHFDLEQSQNGYPRKRSSSAISRQSYRSLRAPPHLRKSQASPMSRERSFSGNSRLWLHSQTDVMGSSLVLPTIRVEEVTMETCEDNERSVVENIKIVFRSKQVWLLCFSSFCFIFGYGMNTVHFPSFAEQQGVARGSISQFYIAFGLIILMSRLGGGILLNGLRSKPPLSILLVILQLVMGMVIGLAPFYATGLGGLYVMQMGIALTYGMGYMLFAPICVQMLGVDLLAISFGLVQLFIGVGYIGSPIIAGYLYDATGTFDFPLILGGSVITLGALPLSVASCMTSCTAPAVAKGRHIEASVHVEGQRMLARETEA